MRCRRPRTTSRRSAARSRPGAQQRDCQCDGGGRRADARRDHERDDLDRAAPTALADGTYNVQATATDLAGNKSATATSVLTVDTTLPVVTINPLPPTKNNKPTISGTVNGSAAQQRDGQRNRGIVGIGDRRSPRPSTAQPGASWRQRRWPTGPTTSRLRPRTWRGIAPLQPAY